ncbi:hypothetical protein LshimejAT787_0108380 [Lyophyllum shimeji]|uniref:Uncharacterized protein n=1 Tax=Lyophyllum shimeji TaxID=47721 RepID=A0A9P3UHG9_LYOSH|nr:hypothetical protein LshimejAT787_0108380 [Lyophyllum shimeji]
MPSSELSNALNPYVGQSRSRTSSSTYFTPYDTVAPTPVQPYVPHRSELELAISEPPPPPPPAIATNTVTTRQPNPASVQAVQELLRIVAATRESQEIERKRRAAWEQEQEAKFTQKQAEMERIMLEMRQEIMTLRSTIRGTTKTPASTGLLTPQHNMSPPLAVQRPPQPASPISPVSQPSSYTYPAFVQGSSTQPFQRHQSYDGDYQMSCQSEPAVIETPAPSVTPSPSPQLTFVQPSQLHHGVSPLPVKRKKRHTSDLSSDDDDSNSSDSSASNKGRPLKRASHHDKRCLTIHHAIREHILRLMQVESDKELPDSHKEGAPLGPDDAVRFVWDKTTKQSVHNSRMKARVIADIKANRRMYKHVPDKDFGKKVLAAAFDASFVTFRQKFKAQRDEALALHHKKREEAKARKARHVSRRKLKLTNRADARMKVTALQHVTFDGALQMECMSSEESEDDGTGLRSGMLHTRGYLWRSTRLKRFYSILDDEEKADKFLMPKRGVGKKERCTGPPKDGFHLPPKGVATWMISRHWIKASQKQYPDLPDVLAKLVQDPPGFDWDHFDVLGDASEVSGDELPTLDEQHSYTPSHHALGMSSLNYALA